MAKIDILASSQEQCWITPPHIFQAIQDYLGGSIALDAAAVANSCRVPNYLGPDHEVPDRRDALSDVSWSEWLRQDEAWYLNPPYGSLVHRWIKRCAMEGKYRLGAALVHSNTESRFFRFAWETAHTVLFIHGRLYFLHPDTLEPIRDKEGHIVTTTKGHMVPVWRPGHRGGCPIVVDVVGHDLRPLTRS